MEVFLVHHFLERSASCYPDKIAVIHGTKQITYHQLNAYATKLAGFLMQQGVKKGDRVAILLENSINYIISYYAILKMGGIEVSMNINAGDDMLSTILQDSQVAAVITTNSKIKFLDTVLPQLTECHLKISENETDKWSPFYLDHIFRQDFPGIDFPQMIDLEIASIVYTSGSTGKPRGAVLTHLNFVQNTRSIVTYLRLNEKDRILVVLPFFYIYGKSLLNTHFFAGGSVVIENRFAFPNLAVKALKINEITGFAGVPSTFAILLNRSLFRKEQFPHLRYITQAGGAMAPVLTQQLMQVLPDKQIFIMYGATEAAARLACSDPEILPRKIGSIGKAIPNVELKIVNNQNEECQPGEVGEIVARGSNIMSHYWNAVAETRNVLYSEEYHTGDLARMDEEGYLFIVGRKKDMIKSGAHRISAQEIEAVLMQHHEVLEVAVIGEPDEILGEAIKAFVVMKNGDIGDSRNLKRYCATKLASFKIPRDFVIVKALPKNAAGKIMKEELRNK